jgi:hypothetical protein
MHFYVGEILALQKVGVTQLVVRKCHDGPQKQYKVSDVHKLH